jgi:hypothetical protein
MMRLAALLLGLATSAPSADIYPPPQQYHPLSGQVALTGWPVGSDDASATPSAKLIADLLQSFGPSPLAGLPLSHFIAVGLLDAIIRLRHPGEEAHRHRLRSGAEREGGLRSDDF